ncbi:MAG TPA: Gfo/Idh/MocA family oxidoreductase [Gemmatimonadales bacterium]|nr:Gfo/Idh/MocA family oxidoreductase [Gemmatimonadales bacterium]
MTSSVGGKVGLPRVGFLGVGWIGRNRLEALARSGMVEIGAVTDSVVEHATVASQIGNCKTCGTFDELLDAGLDGLVIATPSALHADQSIAALERGVAVFCQKPLGRTERETSRVVAAARAANKLIEVDLSYRFISGVSRIRELIRTGELGTVYTADLVFHNAYGPDKPWFYDATLSGGGCVIDLGSHLVDLALWVLQGEKVVRATSQLYSRGKRLVLPSEEVEDYAIAQLDLEGGATVRLACSWNLPAGRDAVIEASFYGTSGGAALRNVAGSFYDFTVERFRGTSCERLSSPPDEWGGRAALDWASRLAAGGKFDPRAEQLTELAAVVDRIYGRTRATDSGIDSTLRRSTEAVLAGSGLMP